MELKFERSFIRDIDDIGSRAPARAIEKMVKQIKKARSATQIPRLKSLRQSKFEYKIELPVQTKIYWVLCDIKGNTVRFLRIKSETWCKKNL